MLVGHEIESISESLAVVSEQDRNIFTSKTWSVKDSPKEWEKWTVMAENTNGILIFWCQHL